MDWCNVLNILFIVKDMIYFLDCKKVNLNLLLNHRLFLIFLPDASWKLWTDSNRRYFQPDTIFKKPPIFIAWNIRKIGKICICLNNYVINTIIKIQTFIKYCWQPFLNFLTNYYIIVCTHTFFRHSLKW